MNKTVIFIFAVILAMLLSCGQPEVKITEEQAKAFAADHLRQYGHYPSEVLLVEAAQGEGWTNQYWENFNGPSVEGNKLTCWVVRFYYRVAGLDGQLLVFVDNNSGKVVGGTQTQ